MRLVGTRWILLLACGVTAGAVAAPGCATEVREANSSEIKHSETIEEIDKQLEQNPFSEDLIRRKAIILFSEEKYSEVISTVKPLLIRNPKCVMALEATAKSNSRLGNCGLAIDFLNRLIELKPTHEYIMLRASCRTRVGLYDDALMDIDWGAKLRPNDGCSYLLRAEIHRSQRGIDKQFESYVNKAIELSPNDPSVRWGYDLASRLIREEKTKNRISE